MKLTYYQLEGHLTQHLLPVYLISGEELQLKIECLQAIRKAAKSVGFTDRTRLTDLTSENLFNALYSNSLLAEKHLIELDLKNQNVNKNIAMILEEFANNHNANLMLLIDMGKIDTKIEKSAWFKALENLGASIVIWPFTHDKLMQWIGERAHKYKLNLSKEAVELLASYSHQNVSAALQALEKIYLYQPDGVVDANLIANCTLSESRFSVFHFVDYLVSGKCAPALKILEQLKQTGVEPVLILWSITRELRLLHELFEGLKAGADFPQLWKKYRIFKDRQSGLQSFLTKMSAQKTLDLLDHAARLDQLIKGAVKGNIWQAYELFCLRFQA